MISTVEYKTLHDNGKTLCFIGDSHSNRELYRYFKQSRDCVCLRYEDIVIKDQSWIDNHQFIIGASSIQFKKTVVNILEHLCPNYFSVYSTKNHIDNVSIGKGVIINSFNVIIDNTLIGDHTQIATHTILVDSTINGFCHIGPYSQILVAFLGTGCFLGARTSIAGKKNNKITVADYCNFLLGSTVSKNIDMPGTYYSNRRADQLTSLEKKID